MTVAKYKNVGTSQLLHGPCGQGCPPPQEFNPGAEFEADLSQEQEAFWLKTGAIEKLPAKAAKPDKG